MNNDRFIFFIRKKWNVNELKEGFKQINQECERMKKIKCSKCGYSWNTESVMLWVTCPNCRKQVRVNILTKKNKTTELRK